MLDVQERGETALDWWDRTTARNPDALAVSDGDLSLTRSELSQRSEQLAGSLLAIGVGRGDRVGVCVERSAAMVVAILAVVRAGAAYVAIDPTYPADRITWMLEDSTAAAVIVSADSTAHGGPGATARLAIGSDGRVAADPDVDADGLAVGKPLTPAEAAYVVYTSGSTGRPKGVTIDHGGLLNLVRWHCDAFALRGGDSCSQIASPGFDAAVWEIWPSLAAGAALVIVPDILRTDPLGLRDWLVQQRIGVGFVPTAVAEGLIGLHWPTDTALRYLLIGGDALTRRPLPELPFAVINNYGVSEAAVVATSGPVAAFGDLPPTIGRPIDGVLAEVVEASGQPLGVGEEGELVLGGVAVGRGYINLPELTAERFYENERGRWYRTGDLMRFTADGELEFRGRLDDQLSIRGFRVEPAEVAGALSAHPAITASAAVAAGDSSGERRLVACVVAADGRRPSDAELSAFLAPRLPDHMRPSAYVWLDALPMTAHGKVDRAALSDLAEVSARAGDRQPGGSATPEASLETTVASIIADLLGVETVGVEQNFFLVGGHSLLAAQLIVQLADRYDVEISLRFLFDHPTARELAAEVRRELDALADDDPGTFDPETAR